MNASQKILSFWNDSATSNHKDNSDESYKIIANEIIDSIPSDQRSLSTLDIGCGAGELTSHLKDRINIVNCVDTSQSMIDQCLKRLNSSRIIVSKISDIEDFLKQDKNQVWIASASINQYLNKDGLDNIIKIFYDNNHVVHFYLFFTIDPRLYFSNKLQTNKFLLKSILKGIYFKCIRSIYFNKRFFYVNPRIGFCIEKNYWYEFSNIFSLKLSNSINYNYRYNIVLSK